jgi:hypothetical protein
MGGFRRPEQLETFASADTLLDDRLDKLITVIVTCHPAFGVDYRPISSPKRSRSKASPEASGRGRTWSRICCLDRAEMRNRELAMPECARTA